MKILSVVAMLFFLPCVGAAAPSAGKPSSPPEVAVSSDHPHEAMSPDQIQAWVSSGVAGIPPLMSALGKADWEKYTADDCGEEFTGSLLQVTREMTKRSVSCARAFSEVLKSTTTSSGQRYGVLLGLSGVDRVPPPLYDGLVSCLSDTSSGNRMRASELLARSGARQAAPAIKAAMTRETDHSTRQRMSYHLYLLGDPAGDSQALRR